MYGPLLKLSYVGDSGKNFLMRDLAKSDVYPLGWCQMNKARLAMCQWIAFKILIISNRAR